MQIPFRGLSTAALYVLMMGAAQAIDGVTLGLGVDYSSGAYGELTATDILFIPAFFKWEKDPWTVKLSIPYVQIRGPGGVVLNGEKPITAQSSTATTTTQRGLGDVVLAATRTMWGSASGHVGADLTGKIKFPSADETKGLGTGKTDYAVLVDVYGALGAISLFTGAGHRWMGQPPGANYRNVWSGNVGLSYKVLPSVSGGVMYDYRESVSTTRPGASEITPFVSFKLGADVKLQWYGSFGLSDGSPDRSMGLVLQQAY